MNQLISLLVLLILVGCTDPDSDKNELQIGQAIVAIDNHQQTVQATWGTRILDTTEFEQIKLAFNDSVYIEILDQVKSAKINRISLAQ